MKIAQVAPLYEAVPPKLYGGTERVVASLCDALTDLGHDVTLFAAGDARTKARLVACREQALRLDPKLLTCELSAHLSMLHEVRRHASSFDVLHFHTHLLHLPFFENLAGSTVTTLHGRLDIPDLHATLARWPQFGLVSISDSQRAPIPNANWLATVPHGLAPGLHLPPRAPVKPYLAFLGRLSPEKRADMAIRLAKRVRIPLKIAAKVDRADADYFEEVIRPLLDDPLIEFVGEIGDADKPRFLGDALALLFPIHWPEPFGLVMIESMACGTPVVAWNCGSVPEVLDDGVTGFIVDSEEAAAQAIERAVHLDRQRVREVFARRFTAKAMAESYIHVYEKLLRSHRDRVRLVS
ncbi:MAG TPA: glycosyltransferase family 4 protein [Steroidobacteraceae bacterium]|jgi:glycosyltransferase involved in cell wall biosynthesis